MSTPQPRTPTAEQLRKHAERKAYIAQIGPLLAESDKLGTNSETEENVRANFERAMLINAWFEKNYDTSGVVRDRKSGEVEKMEIPKVSHDVALVGAREKDGGDSDGRRGRMEKKALAEARWWRNVLGWCVEKGVGGSETKERLEGMECVVEELEAKLAE